MLDKKGELVPSGALCMWIHKHYCYHRLGLNGSDRVLAVLGRRRVLKVSGSSPGDNHLFNFVEPRINYHLQCFCMIILLRIYVRNHFWAMKIHLYYLLEEVPANLLVYGKCVGSSLLLLFLIRFGFL